MRTIDKSFMTNSIGCFGEKLDPSSDNTNIKGGGFYSENYFMKLMPKLAMEVL